jgi:hypothetical protein
MFDEYQDAEIVSCTAHSFIAVECLMRVNFKYEALRRVHLIPSEDTPQEAADAVNANVFRNLDSPVSEGGENFSTGSVA